MEMKNNPYILVVDDDQDILKIVSRTLILEGYGVATANNGNSALALMEERKPDLLILDIVMPPGLDGFQVLNIVRQTSDVPVLILTGECGLSSLQQALVAGADDYVKKPFSTRVLVARVKAKLRRAGKSALPKTVSVPTLEEV